MKKKDRTPDPIKIKPGLSERERVHSTHQIGVIAGTNGRYDLAIQQFRKVLREQPNHLEANHDLALAYAKQGKMRQAMEQFQKVLQINPNFPEAYYNLSVCYFRMNQPELAEEYLERALEKNPNHAKALLSKAKLAERRGQLRVATKIYAHYIQINPSDHKTRAKIGSLYFQQGLDENAKIELKKTVKHIQTPQVLYQLGVIYHRQGDFSKAERLYEAVITKDANHVDSLISMGEILERKGDIQRALIHFERAYGLESHNEYVRNKIQKLRRG